MRNTYIIGGALIIGLLIVSGLVYTTYFKSTANLPSTPTNATTTEQTPGHTITALPLSNDIRTIMPSLTRKIMFTDSVPQNARASITAKIDFFRAKLDKDPTAANDWLDLALWYHTANDYQGAKEIWEFLSDHIPNETTSLDNLGKLYHFDLKEFAKAETYFQKSITVDPNHITPYLELHTLYRYSYKMNTTLAVDILEKAAKQFPTDTDALSLLGAYWRDKGDSAKARAAYERALDRARKAQNLDQIKAFGDELAKLPN